MNLQSFKTVGQRVLSTTRDRISQLKERLASLRSESAAVDTSGNDSEIAEDADAEVKDLLSEKSLSTHLLRLSVVAIVFKALHYFVKREWLLAVVSAIGSLLASPQWIWSVLMRLEGVFMPLVCGIAMTVITWYTVFLDSCIPGVYPPSPVLTKKNGIPYPTTFHLGYFIAIINGFVLSFLIYLGYNSESRI